ncbi:hypothetical protein B0T17DRAFT_531540 [Bombardia bombarda]|uniref:Uncharacterized protein n=1 Tax=Bombardia bombarda TaxID=252184 RepID=A0AA39X0D2_9PEZI|nr:hypothetical protein B0T17DRAFT_531540 [Bombardia bombarda]
MESRESRHAAGRRCPSIRLIVGLIKKNANAPSVVLPSGGRPGCIQPTSKYAVCRCNWPSSFRRSRPICLLRCFGTSKERPKSGASCIREKCTPAAMLARSLCFLPTSLPVFPSACPVAMLAVFAISALASAVLPRRCLPRDTATRSSCLPALLVLACNARMEPGIKDLLHSQRRKKTCQRCTATTEIIPVLALSLSSFGISFIPPQCAYLPTPAASN